jgi:Transposase DDE domain group 1
MGEAENQAVATVQTAVTKVVAEGQVPMVPVALDTFGGKLHVEWDPQAAVTPLGQLPFFIEFLKVSGLFDRFVGECPLEYCSPNAPSKRDVLGTLMLSILAGHRRYAHINNIRSDGVNPRLLGMKRVLSEDAARRALKKMDEQAGIEWLEKELQFLYRPMMRTDWIMDIDTSVKLLYGHQEGAEVGYNPDKPGRPSHSYHSYMMANTRLIMNVEVQPGNQNHATFSAPELFRLLASLLPEMRPRLIRGDIAFGIEPIMSRAEGLEGGEMQYLFKLRLTKGVRSLIERLFNGSLWENAGQGWEGVESELRLSGWSKSRRVVVLRRRIREESITQHKQLRLQFCVTRRDPGQLYEYAVLVTNSSHPIATLAQLYRDRADCENHFDELKNQWGWCGYTTRDLKRCRLISRMIALVYNWWSVFVRLAHPSTHFEAITSRPLLLQAVAKQTEHAGQRRLTITSTHAMAEKVQRALTALSGFLKDLKATAEQLDPFALMYQILNRAFRVLLGGRPLTPPQTALEWASG